MPERVASETRREILQTMGLPMTDSNDEPPGGVCPGRQSMPWTVLSFDVEEHFRIEAATGLEIDPALRADYCRRVEPSTRWILEELECRGIKATFFVVGQIAGHSPALIRAIHATGHEVASHGWSHRRLHAMTPAAFREDLRRSKDALEQVIGAAVVGYRAPTFSLVRRTAWAIDVLAEEGILYDSSIYPVRHDRYGVPQAPRAPFLARGMDREILELPPATLRFLGLNVPLGGGGYFRLLPLSLLERTIAQMRRECDPSVAMLYFHPWEFDPDQPRLPLRRLSRWRTYVGIDRSRDRIAALLPRHRFTRATDVASRLGRHHRELPRFDLIATREAAGATVQAANQ
jgi:polysaccharide deacetylase family protein (PEP-CTERM system associated)